MTSATPDACRPALPRGRRPVVRLRPRLRRAGGAPPLRRQARRRPPRRRSRPSAAQPEAPASGPATERQAPRPASGSPAAGRPGAVPSECARPAAAADPRGLRGRPGRVGPRRVRERPHHGRRRPAHPADQWWRWRRPPAGWTRTPVRCTVRRPGPEGPPPLVATVEQAPVDPDGARRVRARPDPRRGCRLARVPGPDGGRRQGQPGVHVHLRRRQRPARRRAAGATSTASSVRLAGARRTSSTPCWPPRTGRSTSNPGFDVSGIGRAVFNQLTGGSAAARRSRSSTSRCPPARTSSRCGASTGRSCSRSKISKE